MRGRIIVGSVLAVWPVVSTFCAWRGGWWPPEESATETAAGAVAYWLAYGAAATGWLAVCLAALFYGGRELVRFVRRPRG
jgi:hypothetical protein